MPGICPCCGREYDHAEVGTWELFGGLKIGYIHGADDADATEGFVRVDVCEYDLSYLVPEE